MDTQEDNYVYQLQSNSTEQAKKYPIIVIAQVKNYINIFSVIL